MTRRIQYALGLWKTHNNMRFEGLYYDTSYIHKCMKHTNRMYNYKI